MDSKYRHKLEQNELAKWLSNQYEDWIKPNKSWLVYAVMGLLIVIAVIFATARVNAWNRGAAWNQFYAAFDSLNVQSELEIIAQSTSGTVAAHARLALAQLQQAEGSAQVFIDKSKTILLLDKAITSFQQVQKATNDPMLLQQAGFGLGQCWETLAAVRVGDDLAKAEEEYQKVAERWGDGYMMGQRAQKQLALIRQSSTKMVLERMATKTEMEDFGVSINPDDPFLFSPGDLISDMFGQPTPTSIPTPDTEPEQAPAETSDPADSEPDTEQEQE